MRYISATLPISLISLCWATCLSDEIDCHNSNEKISDRMGTFSKEAFLRFKECKERRFELNISKSMRGSTWYVLRII